MSNFNAEFQIVKTTFGAIDTTYSDSLEDAIKTATEWGADTIRKKGEFVPDYDEDGNLLGDTKEFSWQQESCRNYLNK